MTCRLCREEKDLCDSHIIPRFNFKPLKEEEGRFYILSTNPELNTEVVQDGPSEELLCSDCEQLRNQWETYFSRKWHHGDLFTDSYPHRVTGLDYASVKLYQMSLLYLASESGKMLFEDVELRPARKEQLRKMILSESPGPPAEFGCFMDALVEQSIDTRTIVAKPITLKENGIWVHRFIFAGFVWAIVDADTDRIEDEVKERFIRRDGELLIDSKPVRELESLMKSVERLEQQGKLDDFEEP